MAESGIYVIVKESWEYNDEYYHRPECDGYTTHSGWYKESEKGIAEQEVACLNAKANADIKDSLSWEYTRENHDMEKDEPFEFYRLIFVPYRSEKS